jgi:hypothetical protein
VGLLMRDLRTCSLGPVVPSPTESIQCMIDLDVIDECDHCACGKAEVNLYKNSSPDTSYKIDSVLKMVAFKKGALCILGGASKQDDCRVKMYTKFVRESLSKLNSVDPR